MRFKLFSFCFMAPFHKPSGLVNSLTYGNLRFKWKASISKSNPCEKIWWIYKNYG